MRGESGDHPYVIEFEDAHQAELLAPPITLLCAGRVPKGKSQNA